MNYRKKVAIFVGLCFWLITPGFCIAPPSAPLRSISGTQDPAPPYHGTHARGWFSGDGCTHCHSPTGYSIRPILRSECEACHELDLYPSRQPEYAQQQKACIWCHGRDHGPEPTMHDVKDHGTCLDCHDALHRRNLPQRAQCIACHVEQRNHMTDAKTCFTCHPFATHVWRQKGPKPGAPTSIGNR